MIVEQILEEPLGVAQRLLGSWQTMRLLRCIDKTPRPAFEIAYRCGVPLVSTYRILRELRAEGFVQPIPDGKKRKLYLSRIASVKIVIENGRTRAEIRIRETE